MNAVVKQAADLTVANLQLPPNKDFSIKEAAIIVRAFLINLQPSLSVWRPWMKYGVAVVITILNVLIGEDA